MASPWHSCTLLIIVTDAINRKIRSGIVRTRNSGVNRNFDPILTVLDLP